MNASRLKLKASRLKLVLCGTGAVAILILFAPAAFAGTNGQHVDVVSNTSIEQYVQVCGDNQNGVNTCTPIAYAPQIATKFDGYWFKGIVRIWSWEAYLTGEKEQNCDVPANQGSDNWTTCWTYWELHP